MHFNGKRKKVCIYYFFFGCLYNDSLFFYSSVPDVPSLGLPARLYVSGSLNLGV